MSEETRTLPTFIVGGAAKCGTTSIHAYLDQHPEIGMSIPKQTHFFDTDELYNKGLDLCSTYYTHISGAKAVGETTPTYLHGKYIAERIKSSLPGIKMLFIFRDPVKRAYSNYWHGVRRGRRIGSFAECVDDPTCRHFWEQSRYAPYLQDYFDVFGRDRVHVLLLEQLKKEPAETLSRVWRFLGVDESVQIQQANRGEARNTHKMPRSMAFQRFINDYVSPSRQPEKVFEYDENGRLVSRFKMANFVNVRRALMRVLVPLNQKPAVYPPMDEDEAWEVSKIFKEDNERFAEMTGIDIHKWWTYV